MKLFGKYVSSLCDAARLAKAFKPASLFLYYFKFVLFHQFSETILCPGPIKVTCEGGWGWLPQALQLSNYKVAGLVKGRLVKLWLCTLIIDSYERANNSFRLKTAPNDALLIPLISVLFCNLSKFGKFWWESWCEPPTSSLVNATTIYWSLEQLDYSGYS